MTVFKSLLVPMILTSTCAFAELETACGRLLKADPHYRHIEGQMFDRPAIQDLMTLRFDRFHQPILLVGEAAAGKTLLVNALLSKATVLDVPNVQIRRHALSSNIPALRTRMTQSFFFEHGLNPTDLIEQLPFRSLVVIDYELRDFFPLRPGAEKDEEGVYDANAVANSLDVITAAVLKTRALAIQTIPNEAFRKLVEHTGATLFSLYTIISMDTGEILTAPRGRPDSRL